jgi:hypothetical protein
MNPALDNFLKEVIKEYDDYTALGYMYGVGTINKVYVGTDIFKEVLSTKAFPPTVRIDTIFHEGAHLCLDENLRHNEAVTYKSYYFNGSPDKNSVHYCGNHRKKYIGFTEVYDFCTVCDKKLDT